MQNCALPPLQSEGDCCFKTSFYLLLSQQSVVIVLSNSVLRFMSFK